MCLCGAGVCLVGGRDCGEATGAAVHEAEGGWWKMTSGRNRGRIMAGL